MQRKKILETILIDSDVCYNNDENDIGGCKGNPQTKHKDNRYTGIPFILSVLFANFLLRPNVY